MTLHLGDVPAGSTIYIPFTTYDKTNGASVTMTGLAVTDIEIYKDGSTTQRASDNGYTLLDTDGIDFDSAIVAQLLADFEARTATLLTDRVAIQRVYDSAEGAKMALSTLKESRIHVPFVSIVQGKPVDLDVTLTRSTLEKRTRTLVDRTMEVCQEVIGQRKHAGA